MLSKHQMYKFLLSLSLCLPLGVSLSTIAEEIRIPIGQQAGEETNLPIPSKGSSKTQVEATFGAPNEKTAPKGNPPISQWKYNEFVVYFEYDHVIHSVRVFKPKQQP